MNSQQKYIKRIFDIILAIICLGLFIFPIILLIVLSSFDTKELGLFWQIRVGQNQKLFRIIKIKTFNQKGNCSKFGNFLRKFKLDETPQLINILIGNMSFVGPRPDVIGFADNLKGNDRTILTIKPGLTGPATLEFCNEEELLNNVSNPEEYNENVIWPKKVKLNIEYIDNYHFSKDVKYLIKTLLNVF